MKQLHTKLCQCAPCVLRRFNEVIARLQTFESKNHIRPTSPDQTVLVKPYRVRGHFKRHPGHMNKDPGLQARFHDYLVNVTKPLKREPKNETRIVVPVVPRNKPGV